MCPITASSQPARRPTPGRGWPGGPWSAGPCAVCPAPGIGLRLQQGPRSPSVGRPGPVGAPRTPLQHSAWSGARARTDTQRWPAPLHHSPFPLLPRVTPYMKRTPCSQRFSVGLWGVARPGNHRPLPGEGAPSGSARHFQFSATGKHRENPQPAPSKADALGGPGGLAFPGSLSWSFKTVPAPTGGLAGGKGLPPCGGSSRRNMYNKEKL